MASVQILPLVPHRLGRHDSILHMPLESLRRLFELPRVDRPSLKRTVDDASGAVLFLKVSSRSLILDRREGEL